MKAFARKAVGLPVLIAATSLASTSCSSVPHAATNAVAASTGALLGHEFTDGEPEGALLGAAAGVVTGEVLHHVQQSKEAKAFTTGYNKGRSDEVKRLYWVQKNLHRGDEFSDGADLFPAYYEMPVPEHVSSDGTIIEPHTEVIEVLEP